jgi:hypothetical protein
MVIRARFGRDLGVIWARWRLGCGPYALDWRGACVGARDRDALGVIPGDARADRDSIGARSASRRRLSDARGVDRLAIACAARRAFGGVFVYMCYCSCD